MKEPETQGELIANEIQRDIYEECFLGQASFGYLLEFQLPRIVGAIYVKLYIANSASAL